MSDKRFVIKSTATELELYDDDVQIGEFPHFEWVAKSVDSVVDLLNELAEENNKLKVLLKNADRQAEIGRSYVQQYCSPQQEINYTKRIDNVQNQLTVELGNDYLTLACKYL